MNTERYFSVFKTAGRGLAAQREQLSVASENIANANTTVGADGTAYKPKTIRASVGGEHRFENALKESLLQMNATNTAHRVEPMAGERSDGIPDLGPRTEIVQQDKFRFEYDPEHPDADANGMVKYPDVDMVEEMTRMISANRLYEANLSVIDAEKTMVKNAFEI